MSVGGHRYSEGVRTQWLGGGWNLVLHQNCCTALVVVQNQVESSYFLSISIEWRLSDTTEVVYKKQNSLFVLQGQTGHIFIGPCWPGTALVLFWW